MSALSHAGSAAALAATSPGLDEWRQLAAERPEMVPCCQAQIHGRAARWAGSGQALMG